MCVCVGVLFRQHNCINDMNDAIGCWNVCLGYVDVVNLHTICKWNGLNKTAVGAQPKPVIVSCHTSHTSARGLFRRSVTSKLEMHCNHKIYLKTTYKSHSQPQHLLPFSPNPPIHTHTHARMHARTQTHRLTLSHTYTHTDLVCNNLALGSIAYSCVSPTHFCSNTLLAALSGTLPAVGGRIP